MADRKVVVIGAGVGGLVAALRLAAAGIDVTVVERQGKCGGKLRESELGRDLRADAGPTVFTMRWIFDEILGEIGEALEEHLRLTPATILARHAWADGGRLDLFADRDASARAIADFAGDREAQGFLAFTRQARRTFEALDRPFIRAERPSLERLIAGAGLSGLASLWTMRPFTSLWSALGAHFHDPRLRQLFARYATYCGSSPFLAPATLMLVAHVEQEGVWLVEGGMARLVEALVRMAEARGVHFRLASEVRAIPVEAGRAAGVTLADGERLAADAVVFNGDAAALSAGLLGAEAARTLDRVRSPGRSLSAVTFAMAAQTRGFPLERHNIFFSGDYRAEFDDIFDRRILPREPTTYLCAHDRDGGAAPEKAERLLLLINAPATGDADPFKLTEIARCQDSVMGLLARCGLTVEARPEAITVTTPEDWEGLFPGTGGALYGMASHGWAASFDRPTTRTRIPGLYRAGGSIHPGPGIPMAALSGRMAALGVIADLASTRRFRRTATSGGMSMG